MTATEMIQASLRSIGVLASGETASADDAATGLQYLGMLLSSWVNEGLTIPTLTEDSVTLIVGIRSYTIGASGGTVTVRPDEIRSAWIVDSSGMQHPVRIIQAEEWSSEPYPALSGRPDRIWYNPTYPNGTINLLYTPDAIETLKILSVKPLAEPANLAASVVIPRPYDLPVMRNLAAELLAEFPNMTVSELILGQAKEAKRSLKNMNAARTMQSCALEITSVGRSRSIYDA